MTESAFAMFQIAVGVIVVFFGTWMLLSPRWWRDKALRPFSRRLDGGSIPGPQIGRVQWAGGLLVCLGIAGVVLATWSLIAR